MIQLYLRQDLTKKKERQIVRNFNEREIFLITGSWGRLSDQVFLYDIGGELLCKAVQTRMSLFPTFDIYVSGEIVTSLVKKPGFYQPYFTLKEIGWKIQGDFIERDYHITNGPEEIMQLNKVYLNGQDIYLMKINEEANAPLSCLLAVLIDHFSPAPDEEESTSLSLADIDYLLKNHMDISRKGLVEKHEHTLLSNRSKDYSRH